MASGQPILQFDVEYPERLSRWKIFFKGLFAIPHLIVLYLFGAVISITTFLAWFAIVFTGRYPQGLFNLAVMFFRWEARVFAYMGLMRDEYPPFGEGPYPVRFELDYPEHLSRLMAIVKALLGGLLLLPHLIILFFLFVGWYITAFIAWWAILITGRYPRGLFDFAVGFMRWGARVGVYMYYLTDAYPPFTLAPVPSPTTGFATGMA